MLPGAWSGPVSGNGTYALFEIKVVSWLFGCYFIDPLSDFMRAGNVIRCLQGWDLTVPVTKMSPMWSEKAPRET